MKKKVLKIALAAVIAAAPLSAFAAEFGVVDAAQIFNKYKETQKTKQVLESEKSKLQNQLEQKKADVKKLDDEYVATAKKIQDLRDNKKEAEAKALENQLKDLRQKLAQESAELQKFFESSQKRLYEMEEQQMGSLSKSLDERVDKVIEQVAKKNNIKVVFEKRFFYYGDDKVVKDITEEVLQLLNTK